MPKVSIIIPFRKEDGYLRHCISMIRKQDFRNYEIILLPDSGYDTKEKRTKVVPTGPVKPARKRNMAASVAKGDVLAFIDADAYPKKNWLSSALKCMEEKDVGIVGGPNVSPPDDSMMQKAGDDVLTSFVASGGFSMRYSVRRGQDVEELPSCNMLVRKDTFEKAGGFDESILTGEDAKLCFRVRSLGKRVVYCPDVIVFHHRRPLFIPHARQIWNYGRDKATVLKTDRPGGSTIYFAPSVFVLLAAAGFVLSFNPFLDLQLVRTLYFFTIFLYLGVVCVSSVTRSPRRFFLVIPGTVLTHFSYGAGFIYGVLRHHRAG
jgi:glycosyltransferase involved in cell wall biosynthesis